MNGKNAGTATTEHAQVLTAYQHMDGELHWDLLMPNPNTTIAEFVQQIGNQKDIWYDIYKPGQNQSLLLQNRILNCNNQDRNQLQGGYS